MVTRWLDQYEFPGLAARAIKPKAYEVLTNEFKASGTIANDAFWTRLEEMQAYRWRYRTPLIIYYGESDEVVPVYIARMAEGTHQVLGGGSNTKAISAGPKADHRATYIYSLIHVKPWFDGFLK